MRPLKAAGLDPSSPQMQAEFEKLKDASRGFVEKELELMGIPYSADMDDMTIKLRLMEARIVMAAPAAAGPAANASPYEKLVFEKPAIKAYVDRLYNKGDINGANIFMEYINDPQQAKNRYGKEAAYQAVFAKADELMAAPAFTSAKLAYSGFPMMGEDGLRGQMESIGAVKAFSVTEEDPVTGMCERQTACAGCAPGASRACSQTSAQRHCRTRCASLPCEPRQRAPQRLRRPERRHEPCR